MKYYLNQSNILISLDTGISLASAANTRILYTKPNGLKGYWSGSFSGNSINYQVNNGDLDQAGQWKIQAYCEIGGKKAYGGVVEFEVNKSLA